MNETASLGPGRHEARERVLGLLYESEARDVTGAEVLEDQPLTPNAYAVAAVQGIDGARSEIDALIEEHADGWTVERLPNVDRAILRLAVWELLAQPEVPPAVVMDEAVELAKEYSTERSSSFVNGVIDAIARTLND